MANVEHSTLLNADAHEPKHITDALTTDAGKAITPSSTSAGTSELRQLKLNEITDHDVVRITQASDFPAPISIGGVSTIRPEEKQYLIVNDVTLTTPIAWPGAGKQCQFQAINRSTITYTGTDSLWRDPAAEGQIEIDGLTQWEAPNGNMFDATAGAGGFGFQAKAGPRFTNCNGLGTLNGGGNSTTSIFFGTLSNFDTGLTANNMSFFEINTVFVFGNNLAGNTYFTVQGASTAGSINFILNTYISGSNTTLFDFNTNIQSGIDSLNLRGNQEEGGLNGTVFKAGSLDEKDNKVISIGNQIIGDSIPGGLLSLTGNTTDTVIAAVDTPVLVAGTWVVEDESQFTGTTGGRLTYNDVRDLSRPIDISISVEPASGNGKVIRAYVAKNGTIVTNSGKSVTVDNGKPANMYICWDEDVVTNDFIEVFIENKTDAIDITVTDCVLRIP